MLITSRKSIEEIQREFGKLFPYLKLEFYKKSHKTGEGSPIKDEIKSDKLLSDLIEESVNKELMIFPSMQVCELEQQFETLFNLHVQVWRKSGSIWLQTISTDEWTLEAQNSHGKESVKSIEI